MSLMMMRAAILAQGSAGGSDPGADPDAQALVEMDVTRVPSGYTVSNETLTVVNTGSSNNRRWVPAEKLIPANFLGVVYWEVAVQATQTGTLNGYNGVHPAPLIDDGSFGHDAGNNPGQADGAIAYRGNGTIWADGSSRTSAPEPYGDGDVLMFAFRPSDGALWAGRNGVWARDPDVEVPNYSTPNLNAEGWLPLIQGRDAGDGGTLRSVEDQFSYAVPVAARPYGGVLQNTVQDFEAAGLELFVELGGEKRASVGLVDEWYEMGAGASFTTASFEIWIEEDIT